MASTNSVSCRRYRLEEVGSIVRLFKSVFSDSEGEAEGALIGKLAADLFETTQERDLFNYVAVDDDQVFGSLFFTRLDFHNTCDVFILAPVAVHPDRQGQGIGQALISHGIADLANRDIDAVLTYGDPKFYEKVGFRPISPAVVRAPFELSQPEGWLGQSLVEDFIETLSGQCRCVHALANPVYW